MSEAAGSRWKPLLLGLLVVWVFGTGSRNPDCEYRALVEGDQASDEITSQEDVLFAAENDVTFSGDSSDPINSQVSWFADDMSRLVLYTWPQSYSASSWEAIDNSFGVVAAREYAWSAPWSYGFHGQGVGPAERVLLNPGSACSGASVRRGGTSKA